MKMFLEKKLDTVVACAEEGREMGPVRSIRSFDISVMFYYICGNMLILNKTRLYGKYMVLSKMV